MQGSPVWMEHAAAIDVPGMEAAGITLEDFVYYHVRVSMHIAKLHAAFVVLKVYDTFWHKC